MRAIQLAVACVAVLVATAGQMEAGIMTFDINQTWSQGNGQSDILATSISLGGAGQFTLDPGFGNQYFDFTFAGTGTFSTINSSIEGYYFLDSYSSIEFIGAGNFGDNTFTFDDWDTILVNGATAGVWGGTHDGYLGFRSDTGNFGWINYSFTRAGGVSTLTLLDGAYEDQAGVGILAGDTAVSAVPEPSSLALFGIGACVAGLGSARRRRRQEQQEATA
ncbi:PEP-CTERM motif protein [Maioricimonas rarisocia]|uniref:PEP-CTERM motif protein n=2 Tax=Maioricimonas rarisocia TaxID=2528026 RepID=A0A517Z745_9PLAN|nr:PEP-CTERM motif protein [Maioricimonas rarisocia]